MNITELVGKRCLLTISEGSWHSNPPVDEYKILEISPNGNWVKLMNIYGRKFWRAITQISFIEELKDLKADKPND